MAKHTKPRQLWNKDQEKIVIDHYADSTPQEMQGLLNGAFDIQQISHKAKHLGITKSGAYKEKYGLSSTGRFLPGMQTWNKGKSNPSSGRAIETQFKPGSVPPNHKSVGTIRITKDGYLEIKIEEGMHKWRLAHRETWKQHHGQYPPRGTALIFKDGNKHNCFDIDNLKLVTRKELMLKNTVHNYPEEIKEVIRLRAVITRKINGHEKRHN